LESNWRTNAGMLGLGYIAPFTGLYPFTLAAKSTDFANRFITNYPFPVRTLALVVDVIPGTGVVAGEVVLVKPNGSASHFPYGFGVTPDRPRTLEV
jgi:hypothetical protein